MSFQITVEPSGRSFSAEGNETLLAAGIRQGIGLPYGCKDGAWLTVRRLADKQV